MYQLVVCMVPVSALAFRHAFTAIDDAAAFCEYTPIEPPAVSAADDVHSTPHQTEVVQQFSFYLLTIGRQITNSPRVFGEWLIQYVDDEGTIGLQDPVGGSGEAGDVWDMVEDVAVQSTKGAIFELSQPHRIPIDNVWVLVTGGQIEASGKFNVRKRLECPRLATQLRANA